jgi:hypothetical protein
MTTTVNVNSLLPTLLLVLFIGLKLTGHIAWSWFWVMSPLWIPAALALAVFTVFGMLYLLRG